MSVREIGKRNAQFPHALPVFSADTQEQALCLIVTVAKRQYDGTYVVPNFGGEVEDIFGMTDRFQSLVNRQTSNTYSN